MGSVLCLRAASLRNVVFAAIALLSMLHGSASLGKADSSTSADDASITEAIALADATSREADIGDVQAGDATPVRPVDGIWLVDTRHLPYCDVGCEQTHAFDYEQYESDACDWIHADRQSFKATDRQTTRTIVYVHGNRVGPCEVRRRGLLVYESLIAQADEDQEDLRFVIFSWPATQVRGPLRDVRLKAARSDPAAYYLARLLEQIDPEVKVSLVGYSFGARVITGSLHLLGGGELGGLVIDDAAPDARNPMCVVMMASAMGDDWLEPNGYHGLALSQVDQMLLLNNRCDPVMKRYHHVGAFGSPSALGHCGVSSISAIGAAADKIRQIDVGHDIGRSHDSMLYLGSPTLMGPTWQFLNCGAFGQPNVVER